MVSIDMDKLEQTVCRLFPMSYVVKHYSVVLKPHNRIKRALEIAGVYRKPPATKEFFYRPKTAPKRKDKNE